MEPTSRERMLLDKLTEAFKLIEEAKVIMDNQHQRIGDLERMLDLATKALVSDDYGDLDSCIAKARDIYSEIASR